MRTDPKFIERILEKMLPLDVVARPMFGGYGLYCQGKNFALVNDDTLFIKVTEPGLTLAGRVSQAPPYPGARPAFKISASKLSDREWLVQLVNETSKALPLAKPKKRRGP